MKHITLALSLLLATNLISQDLKKIDYQVNIGTTISIPYKSVIETCPEFEDSPKTDYSVGMGYFIDFLVSYNITEKYGITSGLNYNMINVKINDKIGLIESKGSQLSTYLHLPIMFNYKLSKGMTFSAGIYGGYLISAKEKGTQYFDVDGLTSASGQDDPVIASINPEQDYDDNIKNDYKEYDFGLSAKVDYETRLNPNLTGVLFTKFNYGLTNILTNEEYVRSSADEWKNINLMIGLGVKF